MFFETISASLLVLIVNLIDLFMVSVAILIEGSSPKSGDFHLKLSIFPRVTQFPVKMHFRFALTNNSFRKKAQEIILNRYTD